MAKKHHCPVCAKRFRTALALFKHCEDTGHTTGEAMRGEMEPDYSATCEVCGQSPIVPATGMCGPCTFGEADTIGGNW
jgi:ribosomal protein L37E